MTLKYNNDGLIPAIIQDVDTKEVLMLGYMSEYSINETLKTKKVTFYSRSRDTLWTKGETSGNYLHLKDFSYDCDKDTILIGAKPEGPTCHTGNISCFFNKVYTAEEKDCHQILEKLEKIVQDRKKNMPDDSYTTSLFNKGIDKIAQKVGEEAVEVVIASKNSDDNELIYETADLLYHLIVLLTERGIELKDIKKELFNRFD
jgi:phosphoribosyl-ATP pyrophosphohydrolase/phosphoribosyl-AMP cyclohydrolase